MPLVYDDEDLQVIWHAARSSFLLITFDHRRATYDGRRFCADHVAKWKGVNTLGFVGKGETSYPKASIEAAWQATAKLRAGFTETVMLGVSMGGYAALKYSKLFDATTVIAISPAWSYSLADWPADVVEPVATRMTAAGIQQQYQPAGMFVRADEVAGTVFILFDPEEPNERLQDGMIEAIYPQAHAIAYRFAQHEVVALIWPIETLRKLIDTCRRNEPEKLRLEANDIRRAHDHSRRNLMRKALQRHPSMLARVSQRREVDWSNTYLVKVLEAQQISNPCIITYHGTGVYFNYVSRRCEHETPAKLQRLASQVKIEVMGNTASFLVDVNGVRHALWVNEQGELVVDFEWPINQAAPRFQITRSTTGIAFAHSGRFLCAEPGGTLLFDRDEVSIWETFTIGSP